MQSDNQQTNKLTTLIGFVFALACLALIWYVAKTFLTLITHTNSDISKAIIAAAATIMVAFVTVVGGKIYESRANIASELRGRKAPVYDQLLKFMSNVLKNAKQGSGVNEKEVLDFLYEYMPQLIIWGSSDVISAWSKFLSQTRTSTGTKEEGAHLLALYENLMLAIRKDLGHQNRRLKRGTLLSFYIKDLDQYEYFKKTR